MLGRQGRISVVLVGGVQLIILGIMGEYLGRLFLESKKRPTYVIRAASKGPEEHEDHHPSRRLRNHPGVD